MDKKFNQFQRISSGSLSLSAIHYHKTDWKVDDLATESLNLQNDDSNDLKVNKFNNQNDNIQDMTIENVRDRRTLNYLKRFYKLRACSIAYPFLFSLAALIYNWFTDYRTILFGFMVGTCIWSFLNLKKLKPNTNKLLSCSIFISIVLCTLDFLIQFGFFSDHGWRQTEVYEYCFSNDYEFEEKVSQAICLTFKILYFAEAAAYTFCLMSLSIFLYATCRLIGLTKFVNEDGTYRVKLEDEVEEEHN